MRMLIVAIRPGLLMRVAILARAILVMPRCHALRRRHRSHALDRDGQRQQKHSKKPEERLRHRRAL